MPRSAIKDYLVESQLFLGRAIVAGIGVVILLLGLVLRLSELQIIDHQHFTTLSRDNRVKLEPLPPTRGLIYDSQGVLLAQNQPAYSLEIIPEKVADIDATLQRLAQIVTIDESDYKRFARLRKQRRRFDGIPIRVKLEPEEVAKFAIVRHQLPGVSIRAKLLREYPLKESAAHVVGYVGRINEQELEMIDESNYSGTSHIGKNGIEKAYEGALHGTVGLQQVEVNASGRVLRVLEGTQPTPGHNLHLFLDQRLQAEAVAAMDGYNGALVALDTQTGGVLALVSKPGFDPNLFVEGISPEIYQMLRDSEDKPLFNRALRGHYPPGSTVKPFFGLAGLERDVIGAEDKRYCPGFYQLPGHTHKYRDWKKWGHGSVTMNIAIVQSCDVYFYDLAYALGVDRMNEFMASFNFGQPTGVDITGELGGLLPSRDWKRNNRRESWYPGETLIMGIGQGYFLATPIQLAAATATLANRGRYIKPRVVRAIQDPGTNGAFIETHPVINELPVKDPQSWEIIIQSMLEVVEDPRGTARAIKSDAYQIAGKTGTAQVYTVKQDEEYDEKTIDKKLRDHALFIAFAPVKNPRIAVAVIVEHGGHGGSVAAPIARRIMDRYLVGGKS